MSQAEDLLNSLAEPAAYSSNDDMRIVIGADRFITVPDSLKRIAVQYDHDIETVTFDCPRYWDDHDMSQMKIYINYLLPNGKTGQYLAKNVAASGRRMSFDWTISNNVTQYRGNLSFLVCIKRTDDSGSEERHWNSELNRDLYISEGLECTQSAISKYPDLITQLLTRMDEVEAIATPEAMQAYADTWLEENHDRLLEEINNKGEEVLASIPDDYATVAAWADEGARNKANVIEQTVTGEVVTIDDSADAYLLGLNLYGKTTQASTTGTQLFDASKLPSATAGGVSITNNWDGSFTVSGSGTTTEAIATSYIVSHEEFANLFKVGTLYLTSTRTRPYFSANVVRESTGETVIQLSHAYTSCEITQDLLDDADIYFTFRIYCGGGEEIIPGTVKPMLHQDGDGTWEPFSGGVASPSPEWPQELVSVGMDGSINNFVCGNNLYNPSDFVNTDADHGTVDADGWITLASNAGASSKWLNHYTKPSPAIIADRQYRICCEVKEITNCTLYMMSHHSSSMGQFSNVTKITATGMTTVTLPAVYDSTEASSMLRSYADITDTTIATKCVFRIWIMPVEVSNSDYEAYSGLQTITASTRNSLPGTPVPSGGNYTDSDGQQWICDEIDFERGVYVQRIWTETITSENELLNVTTLTNTVRFACNLTKHAPYDGGASFGYGLCSHLPFSNAYSADSPHFYTQGNTAWFFLPVECGATADELTVWLSDNPMSIIYQLADPIETPLTAEELANFKMVRSNYPNTTILNDAGAHMAVKYVADTKTYIKTSAPVTGSSQNVVNVKTYGATGDGVTDDTDAIASAIAILPAGGTLYFPSGTYMVDNISLKSDMTVQGDGWCSVIKLLPERTNYHGRNSCLNIENAQNVIVRDIKLDGNRSTQQSTAAAQDQRLNGLFVTSAKDVYIENVWMYNNGYHGCIMVKAENITFSHCRSSDNGFRPIHGHTQIRNCRVSNCICENNGLGLTGGSGFENDAVFFFGAQRLVINDNIVRSNRRGCIDVGAELDTTPAENRIPSLDITITGNVCECFEDLADIPSYESDTGVHKFSSMGIIVHGGEYVTRNVTISGNTIRNAHEAINLYSADNTQTSLNVSVVGNTIIDCSCGVRAVEVSDITITGNQFRNLKEQLMYLQTVERCLISSNNVYTLNTSQHRLSRIVSSSCITVSNNQFISDAQIAVYAPESSTNVVVVGNTMVGFTNAEPVTNPNGHTANNLVIEMSLNDGNESGDSDDGTDDGDDNTGGGTIEKICIDPYANSGFVKPNLTSVSPSSTCSYTTPVEITETDIRYELNTYLTITNGIAPQDYDATNEKAALVFLAGPNLSDAVGIVNLSNGVGDVTFSNSGITGNTNTIWGVQISITSDEVAEAFPTAKYVMAQVLTSFATPDDLASVYHELNDGHAYAYRET